MSEQRGQSATRPARDVVSIHVFATFFLAAEIHLKVGEQVVMWTRPRLSVRGDVCFLVPVEPANMKPSQLSSLDPVRHFAAP